MPLSLSHNLPCTVLGAGLHSALDSSQAPLHCPQNTSTLHLGLVKHPFLLAQSTATSSRKYSWLFFFLLCDLGQAHHTL